MIQLLTGDCREVLRTLPDASVQCVVTSPPYYGLRDYGTAQWEGGDAGCDHAFSMSRHSGLAAAAERCDGIVRNASGPVFARAPQQAWETCGKCGARRIDAQIGLEATPDAYIATMVEVFREVRRVLRPDGTCWVNMGDSYNANQGSGFNGNAGKPTASPKVYTGLAPKQLLMMPARLALALQADGWWLRSDIIWAKPNPMPESVTDRPTNAHEHIFLLTKRSRYYFDNDAIREPHAEPWRSNGEIERNNWSVGGERGSKPMAREYNPAGRSCRNVWTIATAPFPAAHFATFPPELAERCIKAGTSDRGCCAACGAPWVRVTDVSRDDRDFGRDQPPAATSGASNRTINGVVPSFRSPTSTTTGWRAGCRCNAEVVPQTVLDPFSGAGTTALVADRLGRNAIGIDLSHAYVEMARERLVADCPLFADLSPPPPQNDAYDRGMRDLFQEAAD